MDDDVIQYPVLNYSKREVVRVGNALRERLPENHTPEMLQAFRVAYDWRNSHALPMNRVRRELGAHARKMHIEGITAARMKRMSSIRKKLARLPINLTQIQDLGGCRIIVDTLPNARSLIEAYRSGVSSHNLREGDQRDYFAKPKADGYRSFHLVLSFLGCEDERAYDGRRIEVQIRTQLQHSWATAVEAVGLYRGEDLKAGEGNKLWLRLFALMGSEFAEIERTAEIPNTPSRSDRRRELREINDSIRAIDALESLSQGFRAAETFLGTPHARYFLLRYDKTAGIVTVRTFAGVVCIGQAEDFAYGDVVVEVDKVENLRAAYPNYFGDVRAFLSELKNAVFGYDTSYLQAWATSGWRQKVVL